MSLASLSSPPLALPSPLSPTASPRPLLPRTLIKPLTADTSRVNVTFSESTLAKLKRAKELLAGTSDDAVFNRALDTLLEQLAPERRQARREKRQAKRAAKLGATPAAKSKGKLAATSAAEFWTKLAATSPVKCAAKLDTTSIAKCEAKLAATSIAKHPQETTPAPHLPKASREPSGSLSRRGPLADRDLALLDHGGQCAFVSSDGHRCTSRSFIETDHVLPWSLGGSSQRWNFQPLCRTHNAFKGATPPQVPRPLRQTP